MNKFINTFFWRWALFLVANNIYASNPPSQCPEGTESCSIQDQHMGDIDNSSNAEGTQSNSSNSGTSWCQ